MNKGLVYIFEGDGKGKTSAALGVTCRMLLTGGKVAWISWYKEKIWKISEAELPKKFNNLKMFWTGKGFYKGPMDHANEDEHKIAAKNAVKKAISILQKSKDKKVDLLVLDEVIKAVEDGLIGVDEIVSLLEKRGETHVVLTGHHAPVKLREVADLVTEMKKIKHPYDKGVLAVRGMDF